jgi:predicted RNA binding protein YcfA (HicA-like mRNA interferase family)
MAANKLKNIATKDFRKFLENVGCKYLRTNGSHEVWSRNDLKRPIVLPGNKKVVKEYVVKNTLNNLGMTEDEFVEAFTSKNTKGKGQQEGNSGGKTDA